MRAFNVYPEVNGRLCNYCCADARCVIVFYVINNKLKVEHKVVACEQHAMVVIAGEVSS